MEVIEEIGTTEVCVHQGHIGSRQRRFATSNRARPLSSGQMKLQSITLPRENLTKLDTKTRGNKAGYK